MGLRRRTPRLLLLLLLSAVGAGCLDALLEAPYILSTGLHGPERMSPSPSGTILVASAGGLVEIDGEGAARTLDPAPAVAVAATPEVIYVLSADGRLRWAGWAELQAGRATWSAQVLPPGVRDLQSWCNGELRLASAQGVLRWSPEAPELTPAPEVAAGAVLPPLERLELLATGGCEGVLGLSADTLLWLTPTETRVLAERLEAPLAVASDRHGGVWLVAGTPPALWFLTAEGTLEQRARHLGGARDLLFGPGELLDRRNAYLIGEEGRLDYVRALMDSTP